jgi:hypothetical protein
LNKHADAAQQEMSAWLYLVRALKEVEPKFTCEAAVAQAAPAIPILNTLHRRMSPRQFTEAATASTRSGPHASCIPRQALWATMVARTAGHARPRICTQTAGEKV